VAGLVLVRQKPGTAKGVVFITLEDESEVANLIVWPSLFERQRRLVFSAGMMGVRGKVQREGEVIHLIVEHLVDLTQLLRTVGERDEAFPLAAGEATRPGTGRAGATRVRDQGANTSVPLRPGSPQLGVGQSLARCGTSGRSFGPALSSSNGGRPPCSITALGPPRRPQGPDQ
jgi:hypothetical protein